MSSCSGAVYLRIHQNKCIKSSDYGLPSRMQSLLAFGQAPEKGLRTPPWHDSVPGERYELEQADRDRPPVGGREEQHVSVAEVGPEEGGAPGAAGAAAGGGAQLDHLGEGVLGGHRSGVWDLFWSTLWMSLLSFCVSGRAADHQGGRGVKRGAEKARGPLKSTSPPLGQLLEFCCNNLLYHIVKR